MFLTIGLSTYENDHGVDPRPSIRRHLLEATKAEPEQNSSLILAAESTHRKDPLDGFNYYKGGWNISERHYFSSVGFTAAPLFVLAAAWFLGFGVCMLVIGLCHCCFQRQHSGYSRTAYALSLIFLLLFTITSIIGCAILYMGQGKFHKETSNTLDYVVRQADSVVKSLGSVSYYLDDAKDVRIAQIFLPSDSQESIDSVENKINASSARLEQATKDNSDDIQREFESSYNCRSNAAVSFFWFPLVVIGWILVTVTFILGGIFLLLHNVVGDTCVAMDEWVQNPTADSALDDILPCVDNATAQETLRESKDVTLQLVDLVNQFITNISNFNLRPVPPETSPLIFFNQSGSLVPVLCNPFHSNITDRKCSDGEVNFGNAGQEWKSYVCQVSEAGICTTVGRLTPPYYDQLTAISSLASVLYNYGPFLVELGDCTFVRRTFRNISVDHCSGLRRNSRLVVIGLVLVSSGVMLSLIFWLLFAREKKYRGYVKHFESAS
ncbi:hypothetical protein L484_025702 [Morus notabilis]|uniref:Transmembrane protein n=1 Tax=Morus notabilis TaxID=981085 RepID=W9RS76_9ROSA|nr:hypothetical protein L484_025702 [Morus notabilis]